MTAFYMFRLYFPHFEGPFEATAMPLESPGAGHAGGWQWRKKARKGMASTQRSTKSGLANGKPPLAVLAVPLHRAIGLLGTPLENNRFATCLNPQ